MEYLSDEKNKSMPDQCPLAVEDFFSLSNKSATCF